MESPNTYYLNTSVFPAKKASWLRNNEDLNTVSASVDVSAKVDPRKNWHILFLSLSGVACFYLLLTVFSSTANFLVLALVPESFDNKLGTWAINTISEDWRFCQNEAGQAALAKIVGRLKDSSATDFDFRVRIADNPKVNAMAAPGGNIIIFSGLLKSADSPEELAGVLSHEMAHVILRHGTASLAVELLLSLAGVPNQLVSLHRSRGQESEADTKGADLLAASGISIEGFREFFDRLALEEESSAALSFLSTHPHSEERAKTLQDPPNLKAVPLLSNKEWQALKNYCE